MLAADDRSVQVHSCHGPARQIDVLREVLLGLLADDPTLEPRDILVMCPDIETYAPLIVAGFGLGDVVHGAAIPAHRLRVRLADRALTQTNPLLGRGGATARRSPAAAPPPARCSTSPSAAPVRAAVRLHRRRPRRDRRLGRARPASGGVSTARTARRTASTFVAEHLAVRHRPGAGRGRDVRRLARLARHHPAARRRRQQPRRAGRPARRVSSTGCTASSNRSPAHGRSTEWLTRSSDGVDVADPRRRRRRLAGRPGASASSPGARRRRPTRGHRRCACPTSGRCSVGHLAGRPTRANFRTGTLTVCTMVPMRSVPHRVVCLVGLDDGVFPRLGVVDGDDVLARDPMTGERDIRSEDRQLLLDADRRRHRDAGDHLHRRQRVLRAAAAARGAARRVARRARRHHARSRSASDRHRRTSAAAVRHPQRHARRARHAAASRSPSTRRRSTGGQAAAGPPRSAPRRSWPTAAAPRRRTTSRSTT